MDLHFFSSANLAYAIAYAKAYATLRTCNENNTFFSNFSVLLTRAYAKAYATLRTCSHIAENVGPMSLHDLSRDEGGFFNTSYIYLSWARKQPY